MIFFYSLLLLITAAVFPAAIHASEIPAIPKVNIPDLPPSFRDVAIDLRCSALSEFTGRFAKDYLNGLGYKEVGCSEGNGLGGATYELEFQLKNVEDVKSYSIQITMNDNAVPETKLCLQSSNDTFCSAIFNNKTAPGVYHFKTDGDERAAAFINRNYVQPSKNLSMLTPTVSQWVVGSQKYNRIFGKDFSEFVGTMVKRSLILPISLSQGPTTLKVEFTPASNVSKAAGAAKLLGELPTELQSCLGCNDRLCKTTKLNYAFNNRFLSISGTSEGEDSSSVEERGKYGLAWIMDGPDPILNNEPMWRFFCGVSRYSVQVIKN